MSAAITLTDSPAVVALKREFFQLDKRDLDLRFASGSGFRTRTSDEQRELQSIRNRKSEIARLLFNQPTPLVEFDLVGLRSD